ncbi:MAG: hypothetical protein ACOY3M_06525 [Patescibacteria group bacterium]
MEKANERAMQPDEPERRSSVWKIAVVTDKETTVTVVFPMAEELGTARDEKEATQ